MRKFYLHIVIIVFMGTLFSSCKKETEDLSEMSTGTQFFPLEIGKYILYDVDSTYWDDFLRAEVVHRSQMRYEVVDSFYNDAEKLSYTINISRRLTANDPFVADDVIYVTPSDERVVVNQKNLNFIKLVFPVANNTSWDGNAMITSRDRPGFEQFNNENWNYTYHNYNEPYDPGNNYYENTITVNQIDDQLNDPDVDSTIYAYKNFAKEVYAYNVGMIYREIVYWTFQPKAQGGQGGGNGPFVQ